MYTVEPMIPMKSGLGGGFKGMNWAQMESQREETKANITGFLKGERATGGGEGGDPIFHFLLYRRMRVGSRKKLGIGDAETG
jgi:hypothetical protein